MGKSCMANRNLAIFDFDGTTADNAEWFGNALNELVRHNRFREVSAEQREIKSLESAAPSPSAGAGKCHSLPPIADL